jgi:hypothetical protein
MNNSELLLMLYSLLLFVAYRLVPRQDTRGMEALKSYHDYYRKLIADLEVSE